VAHGFVGELERLSALHQSGALSDQEFAAAKGRLLQGGADADSQQPEPSNAQTLQRGLDQLSRMLTREDLAVSQLTVEGQMPRDVRWRVTRDPNPDLTMRATSMRIWGDVSDVDTPEGWRRTRFKDGCRLTANPKYRENAERDIVRVLGALARAYGVSRISFTPSEPPPQVPPASRAAAAPTAASSTTSTESGNVTWRDLASIKWRRISSGGATVIRCGACKHTYNVPSEVVKAYQEHNSRAGRMIRWGEKTSSFGYSHQGDIAFAQMSTALRCARCGSLHPQVGIAK
jgi:hypothetical protein